MNWLRKLVIRLLGIETEGVPQADYDRALARAEKAEQKAVDAQAQVADIAQRLAMLQDGMQSAINERDAAQKALKEVRVIYTQWKDGR